MDIQKKNTWNEEKDKINALVYDIHILLVVEPTNKHITSLFNIICN